MRGHGKMEACSARCVSPSTSMRLPPGRIVEQSLAIAVYVVLPVDLRHVK